MTQHATIAKDQWRSFCGDYSRQHSGWLVKVDTHDPALAALCDEAPPPRLKAMAANLAFQGITLEEDGPHTELLITLADGEEIFTHRLIHPIEIVTLATDEGLHEGLLIHDKNGGLIQIRFREPANPALLDGWVGAGSRERQPPFRLPDGAL